MKEINFVLKNRKLFLKPVSKAKIIRGITSGDLNSPYWPWWHWKRKSEGRPKRKAWNQVLVRL